MTLPCKLLPGLPGKPVLFWVTGLSVEGKASKLTLFHLLAGLSSNSPGLVPGFFLPFLPQ